MTKQIIHILQFLTLAFVLAACGGGGELARNDAGGDNNNPPPVVTNATLVVTISSADGSDGIELSQSNNLVVQAQALDGSGSPIVGELVTFTFSNDELAFFNNDTGTALTDAEGIATIGLEVGMASGSGNVNAAIPTDNATGTAGFTSTGFTAVDNVTLSIAQTDGMPGNTVTEDSPLTVSALVTQANGTPVVGEVVTFVFSIETLASFGNATGTALTNELGIASIDVVVGQDSGSGQITGSVDSGESDSVGFNSEGTATAVQIPTSLSLFSSAAQLASSGLDTIELTAIVRNEQNILLENIAVEFSADQQASIENTQPLTDSLGTARANLTTINNPENRTINVTASIAGFPELAQTVPVNVVGTSIGISGVNSIIIDDSTEYTVLLQDSADAGIAGELVTLTATDSSGVDRTSEFLDEVSVVTSNNGQAIFNFTADSSGEFTLAASAINAVTEFSVTVQEDQFGFVNAPDVNDIEDDLELNVPHQITLSWLREGVPFVGGTVNLSSSRGQIVNSTATTDANGEVVFTIESDNAGFASLIATGSDGSDANVSASAEIAFIATVPDTIQLDATPDSIGPDGETSTITAIVRDSAGNRVGNQIVSFSVDDVANGSLSPAQGTTDRSGVVSTVYTSNSSSSNEAVLLTASIGNVVGEATLSVGDTPFDISLGTGNIIESPDLSTYSKEFSVFVTDADGNPVAGTDVDMSILPLAETDGFAFFKGDWVFDADRGFFVGVVADSCVNEDENDNGLLDEGEDTNGDGSLTPGNVATVTPATVTTDENGQALVNVIYSRQFGFWVNTRITARAQSNGTESRESMIFRLTVASADLTDEASPPPASPYGVLPGCDNFN